VVLLNHGDRVPGDHPIHGVQGVRSFPNGRESGFHPLRDCGEEVWIEKVEEKKDYSVGRPTRISSPSPWRVEPRCPYFGLCGGCQWQHIDAQVQAAFKKNILKEALQRLGRLAEIPPILVIPSPSLTVIGPGSVEGRRRIDGILSGKIPSSRRR